MPYYDIDEPHRDLDPRHDELVKLLVAEMDKGAEGTGPTIIDQRVMNSDRRHVYVIWDDWKDVVEDHRSAAILDAYGEKHGKEQMLKVSIAMGLTSQESEALGISAKLEELQ